SGQQFNSPFFTVVLPDVGKTANPTNMNLTRSSNRSLSCHGISSMNSDGVDNLSPMNAASALQNDSAISAWQELNLNTTDPFLFINGGLILLWQEPHLSPVVII